MRPAEAFLRLLWGDRQHDYLTLWRKDNRNSIHLPIANTREIVDTAESWASAGVDAYYGVLLRSGDFGPYEQGDATQMAAMPGVFVDIDVSSPGAAHKAKKNALPADIDAAAQLLEAVPFAPTTIVHTGGGIHAYWLFPSVFEIKNAADRERAKWILIAVQKKIIAAAKLKHLHVDHTATLPRVLRLPGTKNFKNPAETKDVVLIYDDGPRTSIEDLEQVFWAKRMVGAIETTTGVADVGGGLVLRTRPASDAKQAPDPEWLEETKKRLLRLHDKERLEIAQKILRGESFAEPGERDRMMMLAASIVGFMAARVNRQVEAEDLVELFRPSLTVWSSEPDASKTIDEELAKMEDKLTRALNDAREEFAQGDAIKAKIAKALKRGPGSSSPPASSNGTSNGTNGVHHTQSSIVEQTPVEDALEEESDEDVDGETDLRKLIIQHRTNFYVYNDTLDKYRPPAVREELDLVLRDMYEKAPFVDWYYFDAQGTRRRKDTKRFLMDYATVADDVYFSLSAEKSYFENGIFYEKAGAQRKLTPQFTPEIDQWLRLLGASDAESLFDWMATATWLQWPTAGIYFSGPRSAGKGLFAEGMARLWTTGAPTDIEDALGGWNADLLRCPLVHADEHIPSSRDKNMGAVIRQFVGRSSFAVRRKHMPNATLLGCPRLIVCANNESLLAFAGEHNNGLEDVDALALRFLHMRAPKEAAEYLREFGGREMTESWVHGDLIARHALWLGENRTVELKGSKRLLVEGHSTQMHRSLVMQGFHSAMVLEWIAKLLSAEEVSRAGIMQKGGVKIGQGRIEITASVISEFWEPAIKSHKVPSLSRLGQGLGQISNGKVERPDGHKYWLVDPTLVYEWADRNTLGSVANMRALVESPQVLEKIRPTPRN